MTGCFKNYVVATSPSHMELSTTRIVLGTWLRCMVVTSYLPILIVARWARGAQSRKVADSALALLQPEGLWNTAKLAEPPLGGGREWCMARLESAIQLAGFLQGASFKMNGDSRYEKNREWLG